MPLYISIKANKQAMINVIASTLKHLQLNTSLGGFQICVAGKMRCVYAYYKKAMTQTLNKGLVFFATLKFDAIDNRRTLTAFTPSAGINSDEGGATGLVRSSGFGIGSLGIGHQVC